MLVLSGMVIFGFNTIDSILILLTEMIFGVLAIFTQLAALNSNKGNIEIVHAIAWAVEVLVAVSAFFLLSLFSTTEFAIAGFVVGLVILGGGTFLIYNALKS